MSKATREMKREAREQREKLQAKKVFIGIGVVAIVLVILMFAYYSML